MASPYCCLILLSITQEAQTQWSLQPCSVTLEDSSTAAMALPEQDQHHLPADSSAPAPDVDAVDPQVQPQYSIPQVAVQLRTGAH